MDPNSDLEDPRIRIQIRIRIAIYFEMGIDWIVWAGGYRTVSHKGAVFEIQWLSGSAKVG